MTIHYKFIRLAGNGKIRNPYRAIGNAMDKHAAIGAYAETGTDTRRRVVSITRDHADSPMFVLRPLEGPNVGKAEHHIPVHAVIESDVDVEVMANEDRGRASGREPAGKASDRKDGGGNPAAPSGNPVWTRGRAGGRVQPSGGADGGTSKSGGSVQLPPDVLEDD